MAIDAIAAKVITRSSLASAGGGSAMSGAESGEGFGASLSRLVNGVNETNAKANVAVEGMLAGKTDVHEAMIALQHADHTLQFSVQVRNKLMNAYQEIMRMPV